MDFIIRDLVGPDLSQCFLQTLCSLAEVQLTLEAAGEIHRRRLRSGVRTYIAWATQTNEVVGTVSLLVEPKFIHRGGLVGHIEDVAVRRGFEKQGIGRALVQYATEQARKIGCYKVILNCSEHRVAFYRAVGYRCQEIGMRVDVGGESVSGVAAERAAGAELESRSPESLQRAPSL